MGLVAKIIVVAVCALAMPVASALAAPFGKRVNSNADAVSDYWTPERMRNAIPVERVLAGGPVERAKPGGGGGGGSSWTSGSVDWSVAEAITYTNGKVFFTDGGTNYVCSGTAVSASNGSVVWTAGHCVNDGSGDFHTNWSFVPAYNSDRSLGTFVAEYLYTSSAWATSGEFGEDFGAARVYQKTTGTLTATIGASRPVSTVAGTADDQLGKRRESFGYPAAGKFNGQHLRYCDSYVSRTDSNATPRTMAIPCDMTGGSSGGGWIDDHEQSVSAGPLVSVNSYGYRGLKNTMFGPVLGTEAEAVLVAAGGSGTGVPTSGQLSR